MSKSTKASFFGSAVAAPTMPATNMNTTKLKDMTFKVDPDWHAVYKATASQYQMSMKDLMEESFESWLREGNRQKAKVLKG